MDIVQLKKQIKANKLDNFYIFCGPEIGLQNVYLNQMAHNKVTRVDSVASIWNKITSKNKLFKGGGDKVYAIRDDTDFLKADKVWNDISKIVNGTVVLMITAPDKRSKFYKHFKDDIIEFNMMTTAQLLPTVKKMIKGSDQALKYFIESCSNDYSTVSNEVDKFNRLGISQMTIEVSEMLIPRVQEGDAFKLTDYIIQLDAKNALNELNVLLKQGQSEVGILALMATKLNQCILVEGYRGTKDMAKATGLNGWVVKSIMTTNRLQPAMLLRALRLVQKYDSSIKLGRLEPQIAVVQCVVEILSLG